MLVTIGYTGMRWGETIGLERDLLLPSLINLEWQLREINGRFHRLPPRLVVVDAAAWPGIPVASWPPAAPGMPFVPPSGRGSPRLISTENSGRCQACGHAVRLRLDGRTVAHKNDARGCPGSGEQPASDAPLACWLPVKDGLTPHGLRHSHKTWMAEDGIPEILAEQRLGHQVPGMRGLYAHASQRMLDELTADLQARWEESLRERAAIDPHSTVRLLDTLLAPFRTEPAGRPGKDTISQIPPNMPTAPILRVG
jgi:integrase